MKQSIFAFALAMVLSISVNAQNPDPKVIALVNKASWCHVCQANGPRFEKEIMPMVMENKDVQIVVNDLSNDETKAISKDMLEKAGISKFAQKNTATGMLYFLDANTKKLISKISLVESNEEIKKAYEKALSRG